MEPTLNYLTVFLLFLTHSVLSQDNSKRVQEIKTMYSEINELEKTIDHKQCKTGKKITHESLTSDTSGYPFEQTAEKCLLKNNYSIIKGNFTGYEWAADIWFYYKNSELFFVYTERGAESCYSEYRIYYDTKGSFIKILEKSNNCSGDYAEKNVELTDAEDQKRILTRINEDHAELMEMLK